MEEDVERVAERQQIFTEHDRLIEQRIDGGSVGLLKNGPAGRERSSVSGVTSFAIDGKLFPSEELRLGRTEDDVRPGVAIRVDDGSAGGENDTVERSLGERWEAPGTKHQYPE